MFSRFSRPYYTEKELREMGFKSVGIDVRIAKTAVIRSPENVSIGNHVAIDDFVYISVKADIGNYVHIPTGCIICGSENSYLQMRDYTFTSMNCVLLCGSDDYTSGCLVGPTIPFKHRKVIFGTIVFEKYSGCGAGCVIMPNVTIGEGTLVGAMSLVTKNLEPWGIYVGIPAKRIKERRKDIIEQSVREIESCQ